MLAIFPNSISRRHSWSVALLCLLNLKFNFVEKGCGVWKFNNINEKKYRFPRKSLEDLVDLTIAGQVYLQPCPFMKLHLIGPAQIKNF